MSEIKIPNCPCCDGESKLHDYGGGDFRDGGKQYFIKCEKCGLTTKHSSSKDEVLMTWGKRKPMERINAIFKERAVKYLGDAKMQKHNRFYNIAKQYEARAYSYIEAMNVVKEEGGIE